MINPELDAKLVNDQPQNAVITLSVNEINVVLAALQELPHRIADPILKTIVEQAQSQLKQG